MSKLGFPIDLDTIQYAYTEADEERRVAVSNIIHSDSYMSAVWEENASKEKTGGIFVDWKGEAGVSIGLVMSLIQIGKQEYGETWLKVLRKNISQL